ncbi:MAG: carboxypeptidase regulatory-like domain-containing protein [Candidatus Marinimicrobia bacterium]|jgi:hypothetical protein|nr:carboxypeptidase regulatory-like domain-containing protein [Bacteroidota bacterium]MBT7899575.1 carboxypeptidase regulatory-like domain-containing protein [Candidatus Neomarinimicrobiota bacterium]
MKIRLIIIGSLLLFGCSSPLSVKLLNYDTKSPVTEMSVSAKEKEAPSYTEGNTDSEGLASYEYIKKFPIQIKIEVNDKYFPLDTTIDNGSTKEPLTLYLNELQTIIRGQVIDSTYLGIPNAEIITDPETETVKTDINGYYILKSKLFLDIPYAVMASHKDYEINQLNNIPIYINEENEMEPIELKIKLIKKASDLGGKIIITDPETGEGEIWLEE